MIENALNLEKFSLILGMPPFNYKYKVMMRRDAFSKLVNFMASGSGGPLLGLCSNDYIEKMRVLEWESK